MFEWMPIGGLQGRATVLATVLGLMALEYLWGLALRHDVYDPRETAASLAVAVGHGLTRAIEAALIGGPLLLAYRHRLFHFDSTTPLALAGLFAGSELLYYWQHRTAHRIRWFWATHSVHHSATTLNFSAALRLGWTANLSGTFLFFMPLTWIGFAPLAVAGMLAVNLLYQFFIHSELLPRLGPLEYLLNTPAHHRVHHASNEACLDRNYGGVLILFDRLFGTFAEAPADEPLRYGIVGRIPSTNPLRIVFGEWADMGRDFRRAESWPARLDVLAGPPGATKDRL